MSETTARLAMPMIAPGQMQKEMSHNEALILLDAAVQASVSGFGTDTPPTDPAPGACWIVGDTPSGAWTGHADALAVWTPGGWRFVSPTPGFSVWVIDPGVEARFIGGAWLIASPADPIADPAGGTTIDLQARSAIAAILAVLRDRKLVEAA